MQAILVVLRNPRFQRFILGMLLVVADLIATELGPKKTR